jgi:hypothetical protein
MKLLFNKNIGEVFYKHPVTDEEVSIFPTEDINHDAIEEMLSGYNAEYSLSRVKSNMETDTRLTGDEIDYIIEQLEMFEESQETAGNEAETGTPWTDEDGATFVQKANAPVGTVIEPEDKIDAQIKKGEELIEALPKPRKTRQPRTTISSVPGASKRTLTPQEYMQSLQEKMDLTKLLSETHTPEIPEGLTKDGRKLMVEFASDYNKLIVEYLEKIQNL